MGYTEATFNVNGQAVTVRTVHDKTNKSGWMSDWTVWPDMVQAGYIYQRIVKTIMGTDIELYICSEYTK